MLSLPPPPPPSGAAPHTRFVAKQGCVQADGAGMALRCIGCARCSIRCPPALPRAGEARSCAPAGVQPNSAWNHVQVTMTTAHASGKAKIWANCKCK